MTLLPTHWLDEFLAHWEKVDAALAPQALEIPGGYTRTHLSSDRAALQEATDAVVGAENAHAAAAGLYHARRTEVVGRLCEFCAVVPSICGPDSGIACELPSLPQTSEDERQVIAALEEMGRLWERLHTAAPAGFTPPLNLADGYSLESLLEDIATARALYVSFGLATANEQQAQRKRDALVAQLRGRLEKYQAAVQSQLPPGHPLALSLPDLPPPEALPSSDRGHVGAKA